ncbi:uncharacterized protein ASCRUDRAFT_67877 [Ascoidea rubescens DSM 1968]|uniref:Uncharacterized protein n=1 Tax=Ascoidea rubescens DSM 1968 TaxID=1344418 RepID=A0A1D2VQC9_9ASCO|nr:hypothetical protein ASCRUDRAFT_67877 [Ascoidea rubescens DSM 1968]ODV63814.1 hypothetical protein ASCRUDRAFT_67877 [Ascoidea rubescens DSM 1968]
MFFFSYSLPFTVTRAYLYSFVAGVSIFLVLLFWSFFLFDKIYNYLLPIPTIIVPLNFNYEYIYNRVSPFVLVDLNHIEDSILNLVTFNNHYNFNFNFQSYCDFSKFAYLPLMIKFSILNNELVDDLVLNYQLNNNKNRDFTHTHEHYNNDNTDYARASQIVNSWPLTSSILVNDNLNNNGNILVSILHNFLVSCSNTQNNHNNYNGINNNNNVIENQFLPPILKSFLPPIIYNFPNNLINYFTSFNSKNHHNDLNLNSYSLDLLRDYKFDIKNLPFLKNSSVLIEFNNPNIILDNINSILKINLNYKGLRYYLHNFKVFSYITGISLIWFVSILIYLLFIISFNYYKNTRSRNSNTILSKH